MSKESKKAKARAVKSLIKSTNFVVLSDKDSVIFYENAETNNFDDIFTSSAHLAALDKFIARLTDMRNDVESKIESVFGKKKSTKVSKKIPVKQSGRATKVRVRKS